MSLSDAVALLGLGTLLVGIFADRFHPTLARRRRLLIIVGAAVLLLTAGRDAVRGFRDGFRDGSTSDQRLP
jgi:hypothetical protein